MAHKFQILLVVLSVCAVSQANLTIVDPITGILLPENDVEALLLKLNFKLADINDALKFYGREDEGTSVLKPTIKVDQAKEGKPVSDKKEGEQVKKEGEAETQKTAPGDQTAEEKTKSEDKTVVPKTGDTGAEARTEAEAAIPTSILVGGAIAVLVMLGVGVFFLMKK